MASQPLTCPHCGRLVSPYRNPTPTVDIVIEVDGRGVVLIARRNPPLGWALPGGFVDYGESLEQAAAREALEETGLRVELLGQLGAYSDPSRDARGHTITNVFLARASGRPQGRDDAVRAEIFGPDNLPTPLVFDHARILDDYFRGRGLIRTV
ncbi:MAG: NUDIX hydrolase [Pseudomonadota bacterium]